MLVISFWRTLMRADWVVIVKRLQTANCAHLINSPLHCFDTDFWLIIDNVFSSSSKQKIPEFVEQNRQGGEWVLLYHWVSRVGRRPSNLTLKYYYWGDCGYHRYYNQSHNNHNNHNNQCMWGWACLLRLVSAHPPTTWYSSNWNDWRYCSKNECSNISLPANQSITYFPSKLDFAG